jgi:hypothetical protein
MAEIEQWKAIPRGMSTPLGENQEILPGPNYKKVDVPYNKGGVRS